MYHRQTTGGPELPPSTPYCPSVSIWVPDVSHSIIPRSQEDPPSLCGQVGRLQGHSCVPGTCRSVSSQLRAEMRSRDADGKFSLKYMGTQACWVGVTLLLKSIHLKYSCALIKSVKPQGSRIRSQSTLLKQLSVGPAGWGQEGCMGFSSFRGKDDGKVRQTVAVGCLPRDTLPALQGHLHMEPTKLPLLPPHHMPSPRHPPGCPALAPSSPASPWLVDRRQVSPILFRNTL